MTPQVHANEHGHCVHLFSLRSMTTTMTMTMNDVEYPRSIDGACGTLFVAIGPNSMVRRYQIQRCYYCYCQPQRQ
jgi:hypothetical protein